MKQNTLHFILFLIFFVLFLDGSGQTNTKLQKHFDKALRYFNSQNYSMAIIESQNALEHDSAFVDSYLLLADIYAKMDSAQSEIEHLEIASKYSVNPLIQYRLGEVKYTNGNYENALINYERYLTAQNISENRMSEVQRKMKNCRFAINSIKNPVEFNPKRLSNNINSLFNDYWPSISLDQQKLVFTRLVHSGQLAQEDFFVSENILGEWNLAVPISEINSSQNEGAQILSADGKLMFFTACNRPDGKGSCDIYYSRFNDGKWSEAKNAGDPLNSNAWEAQPGFSSDYRYLYFSSNRFGGKGAKDIWRIEFKSWDNFGNLKWGEVENLGDSINSKGDEISPFIHPNNKNFYFVSDYFTGMGGNDLFSSVQKSDGTFSTSKNLGYPINTNTNELGLNISSDGKTAYFSSERNPEYGLDIYSFELSPEQRPDPVTFVKARVINAKSKQPVEGHIKLANLSNPEAEMRTEMTDKNGEFLVCLPLGANYAFSISEEGYLFFSKSFQLTDTKTIQEPLVFTIQLEPLEIGAEMNLYNIYFETDSFSILSESEPELVQLVNFMKENPTLTVEIQGHTDNSGNVEKNQLLSEKRAQSVVNYLIKNGISFSRLEFKGYGEKNPVAENDTPEGRMLNRRTTIKISGK